eukprot:969439-Pyramimonas_sp.AAC.1
MPSPWLWCGHAIRRAVVWDGDVQVASMIYCGTCGSNVSWESRARAESRCKLLVHCKPPTQTGVKNLVMISQGCHPLPLSPFK